MLDIPSNKIDEVLLEFKNNACDSVSGNETVPTMMKSRKHCSIDSIADIFYKGKTMSVPEGYYHAILEFNLINIDMQYVRNKQLRILTDIEVSNLNFVMLLFVNGIKIPLNKIKYVFTGNCIHLLIDESSIPVKINSCEYIVFSKTIDNNMNVVVIDNDTTEDIKCNNKAMVFYNNVFNGVYNDSIKKSFKNGDTIEFMNLSDISICIKPNKRVISMNGLVRVVYDNILLFKDNKLISNDIIQIKNNIIIFDYIEGIEMILFHKTNITENEYYNEQTEFEKYNNTADYIIKDIAPSFIMDDSNDLVFDYDIRDLVKSNVSLEEYRTSKMKELLSKYPPAYNKLLNQNEDNHIYITEISSDELDEITFTSNSAIVPYSDVTEFDRDMVLLPYRFFNDKEYVIYVNGDLIIPNTNYMFNIPFTNYCQLFVDRSMIGNSDTLLEIEIYDKVLHHIHKIDSSNVKSIVTPTDLTFNGIEHIKVFHKSERDIEITKLCVIKEVGEGFLLTIPERFINADIYVSNTDVLKVFSGYLGDTVNNTEFIVEVDELDYLAPSMNNVLIFKEGKYIPRQYYSIELPSEDNDIEHVTFKCKFAVSQLNTIHVVYSSIERETIKAIPHVNKYGIVKFETDVNVPVTAEYLDIYLNGTKLDNAKHLVSVNNNIVILKEVTSLFDLEILSKNIITEFTDDYIQGAKNWDVYQYYNNMNDADLINLFSLKEIDNTDYRFATSVLLPVVLAQYTAFWEEYKNKILDSNNELTDAEQRKYSALINKNGNVMIDLGVSIGSDKDFILDANDFETPFGTHQAMSFFKHQQLSSYTHQQLGQIKTRM